MLTLRPAMLLKFIKYRSLLLEFWVSSMQSIMSFASNENLTFSFPILIPFIPFPCPIALGTVFNMSGDSGHLYLVPNFRVKLSVFCLFSVMLVIGLS